MQSEKEAFRAMTVREKAEHIWEYYKLPLLGIALVVILVAYIVYKALNPDPEAILNVAMVNASTLAVPEKDAFERYLEEQGYDLEEETAIVDASIFMDNSPEDYAIMETVMARIMVGDLDILIGDEEVLDGLGAIGAFTDMHELLPEEALERHEDKLIYMEPQEGGDPVAGGIWLPEGNPLEEDGYYYEPVAISLIYNGQNKELARDVLLYLLGEEP